MSPWSTEDVYKLINEVERRQSIWNMYCDNYKNRLKKSNAWKEVAEALQRNQDEVKKKFHSLRTQFAAEIKNEKRKSSLEGGKITSKWQYMNGLRFLRRGMKRRKEINNEIDSNVEYENCDLLIKKEIPDSSEEMLPQVVRVLKEQSPDELDIFGQYVAMELRGISCEHIRRRLKREISLAIFKAQDDDQSRQFLQLSPVMWSSATSSPICFKGPRSSSR